MMSISEFNNYVGKNIQVKNNHFEIFLNKKFQNWKQFNRIEKNDNILFYDEEKLIFSIRINKLTGEYKHIDIYVKNNVRPYLRVILHNNIVVKFRYYEYNTWKRNYDVVIANNFIPIYTIEYFDDKKRYIDLYFEQGKSIYNEEGFLKHLNILNNGLKKLWLNNDYNEIYKYMCYCFENDLDLLFKDELFKDNNLSRLIFNQNKNDYSFYKNIVQESIIQPVYWSKVLMFIYRFGHYLKYSCNSKEFENLLVRLYRRYVELFLNCSISLDCNIGDETKISHPFGIIIDSNVKIGTNCVLQHNITIENKKLNQDTIIENNVYICHNSIIKNTRLIGRNSVISEGVIVKENVPNDSIVVQRP